MHFNVHTQTHPVDVAVLEPALLDADPAAMIDRVNDSTVVRVATSLDAAALLGIFGAAGFDIPEECLERLPSDCCGGCGG